MCTVLAVLIGVLATPAAPEASLAGAAPHRDGEQVSRSAVRALQQPEELVAPRLKTPPFKVRGAGKPLRLKPIKVDYSFDVGTLNILGSNHTPRGSGYAPGPVRAGWAAGQIRNRGIDVIGMQEVQPDQIRALNGALGGSYSMWPQEDQLGRNAYRLQIAFRNDLFDITDTGSITTVFSHQMRPIPWVKLRHKETGGEFYFVTIHNSPRDQERDRDVATDQEISLLNSLLSTGLPVFVVGDMNEPDEFFCRVGAATGMVAANGGSATSGGCSVPAPRSIDWIMGGNGTSFSGYVRERVNAISDHPIVHSSVTLTTMGQPKP